VVEDLRMPLYLFIEIASSVPLTVGSAVATRVIQGGCKVWIPCYEGIKVF
jgi:hypothetical protein